MIYNGGFPVPAGCYFDIMQKRNGFVCKVFHGNDLVVSVRASERRLAIERMFDAFADYIFHQIKTLK